MGNLLTLHKDVLKMFFVDYLDRTDRFMLLWAANIKTEPYSQLYFYCILNSHENVFDWLYENKCPLLESGSHLAAGVGNLEILKKCYLRKFNFNDLVCVYAAKNGHVHILEWLKSNNFNVNTQDTLTIAAEHDHLETLKWLINNGCPCYHTIVGNAIIFNRYKIVKYLVCELSLSTIYFPVYIKYAIDMGRLEIAQLLKDVFQEGYPTKNNGIF